MQDIQVRNFSSTFVFCAQKMFSLTTLPYSSHNPSLFAFCINIIFKMIIFFFFNDTATTEIYTFPLHDALPISHAEEGGCVRAGSTEDAVKDAEAVVTMLPAGKHVAEIYRSHIFGNAPTSALLVDCSTIDVRSEEHTSELQSPCNLVCRLLLEKK